MPSAAAPASERSQDRRTFGMAGEAVGQHQARDPLRRASAAIFQRNHPAEAEAADMRRSIP
jgi:hypothetical protein